jgi:ribosome recycling factor
MSIADDVLSDLKSRINRTLDDLRKELSKVRTGRANPAILEGVRVDYYGAPTPLNGVANITVADARLIIIKPWDRSSIQAIEKAIQQADIGINPQADGEVVRIVFPPLTEERRRDLSKVVKNKGEEHKVAIRNERRDAKEMVDEYVKEGELPKDDGDRAIEKIQAEVDAGVKGVDEIVAKKTKDLMEV